MLGQIWYAVLKERLKPDAQFDDFAAATVDVAGNLYGGGGGVQQIVGEAWTEVGLPVPGFAYTSASDPASRRLVRQEATRRRKPM